MGFFSFNTITDTNFTCYIIRLLFLLQLSLIVGIPTEFRSSEAVCLSLKLILYTSSLVYQSICE